MIPAFDPQTGALPAGIHEATWAEVVERFGTSPARRELLAGMRRALLHLASVGCRRVYLAGSFVTARPEAEGRDPGDWDGCYEPIPTTRSTQPGRRPALAKEIALADTFVMKLQYAGEIYNATDVTRTDAPFIEFFQIDRDGRPVGIVALDPATVH